MGKQELLNQGFQHFARREYDQAQKLFEQAIGEDETFEAAYSALAECLNRQGEIARAIDIVQKWIAINPRDPLAHTALSRLYVQKGMIQEAEDEMAISNRLSMENSGL
ncbi:MAG TPA: tetratricopeptide repeat protein [Caldithrix abyssi]|uniref:Tetratricopeptide repeat protein n=1 Tax=Caldithrix abyssi TaxID=187145 RepID=A0A7V5RP00_CALAY|nr:tetratricopeptide repeat protein [Caldithrix abyssi]